MTYLLTRGPYLLFVAVAALGIYLLVAHRHYLKGLVGLYLFQTAIILFFLLLAVRQGATIPIRRDAPGEVLDNPLPHALMLTAIVVSLATTGVALAILRRLYAEEGSIQDHVAADEAPEGEGNPQ